MSCTLRSLKDKISQKTAVSCTLLKLGDRCGSGGYCDSRSCGGARCVDGRTYLQIAIVGIVVVVFVVGVVLEVDIIVIEVAVSS